MRSQENENDDAGFRAALRRAMSPERAPVALRMRVEALFDAQRDIAPSVPRRWRMRIGPINWRLTGAAAAVLLAVGFMSYQIREAFFPNLFTFSRPAAAPVVSQLPLSFAMAMTRAHDHCAKLADHHLLAGEDFAALSAQLNEAQGIAAFAAPVGEGWKFKGAGICEVDAMRTAHLLFVRGERSLSVFSMPTPAVCGGGATEFQQTVENHAIRALRRGDALYVIVASSPTGVACGELDDVFASVQQCISPAMCPSSAPAH
jgi:hypothetical protein